MPNLTQLLAVGRLDDWVAGPLALPDGLAVDGVINFACDMELYNCRHHLPAMRTVC